MLENITNRVSNATYDKSNWNPDILRKAIADRLSNTINAVSNRESEELLLSLAQDIANSVKFCDKSRIITIIKPGTLKSKLAMNGRNNNWVQQILPKFDKQKLQAYAEKLGFSFEIIYEDSSWENYHYVFSFNFYPNQKERETQVQILAYTIRKHFKKVQQKKYAIAKKNSRIEFYQNSEERKKQRRYAYKVYRECVNKLISKHFVVDEYGRINISLKSDEKFDFHRLNKFLARMGLNCIKKEFNLIFIVKK